MDWLTLLTSTTLLGVGSNTSPVHDFTYTYYDAYSSVKSADGTHFFEPKYPEITVQGLTYFNNYGVIWSVTSPYISTKYERGWNFGATAYRDFELDDVSRIRLSLNISSLSEEKISPCLDAMGRSFHCYYGTQTTSPYFTESFAEVEETLYRSHRKTNINSIAVTWISIF